MENLQTRIDEIELKDLIETQLLISDEKHFFLYRNKVFRIEATCNVPQQKADPFLSELLGEPIVLNNSIPADANSVVYVLHQFLANNAMLTQSFSVVLEWGAKDGWGD